MTYDIDFTLYLKGTVRAEGSDIDDAQQEAEAVLAKVAKACETVAMRHANIQDAFCHDDWDFDEYEVAR